MPQKREEGIITPTRRSREESHGGGVYVTKNSTVLQAQDTLGVRGHTASSRTGIQCVWKDEAEKGGHIQADEGCLKCHVRKLFFHELRHPLFYLTAQTFWACVWVSPSSRTTVSWACFLLWPRTPEVRQGETKQHTSQPERPRAYFICAAWGHATSIPWEGTWQDINTNSLSGLFIA